MLGNKCLALISEFEMGQTYSPQFSFCIYLIPFLHVKQGRWMICAVAGVPKLGCIYHYCTQTIVKQH